jgi:hypothetical protein
VTSTLLDAGDPNCPYGGTAFVSGTGVTYACNGAPGAPGVSPQVSETALDAGDPNCPNGGYQFVVYTPAADGGPGTTQTAYACNGASAGTDSGADSGPEASAPAPLVFAIMGGARPANSDDTANYPTATVTRIAQDIAGATPAPAFLLTMGPYMFASPTGSAAQPQLNLFRSAIAAFPRTVYPTMSNHECTGAASSNCPNLDETPNVTDYISTMVAPTGQTLPYYVVNRIGPNGAWTAKFVFVADNAWSGAQQSWLSATLSQQTTYTFVMRHHSLTDTSVPGVSPSEAIVNAAPPITMKIEGSPYEYRHPATREIIVGNGGAPLVSTGGTYGYVIAVQNTDLSMTFTEYDYSTNAVNDTFTVSP